MNVTIHDQRHGTTVNSAHRTSNPDTAVERAVRRQYGKSARFINDNGLMQGVDPGNTRYGQVFRPTSLGNLTSLSGRLQIDIEA